MRLLIQIPCFNEEKTLSLVLRDIPKKIKGISKIDICVIDDGSTDKTVEVAKKLGVDHILIHKKNKGLGNAFKTGLAFAVENNYDILVNTDADNQYPSRYITDLVKPVVEGNADMVVGDRQTSKVAHFSPLKKFFQSFGSGVVRRLTHTDVRDAVSGFRAYSNDAMISMNITTKFSYVLDTIMQLSQKNMKIISVPISVIAPTRKSRLFKNMFQHMYKSGVNVLRLYVVYQPFKFFFMLSIIFLIPGIILALRFLYYFFTVGGAGHLQSLIAMAVLVLASVLFFVLGILGELLKTNRMIMEEMYTDLKRLKNKR